MGYLAAGALLAWAVLALAWRWLSDPDEDDRRPPAAGDSTHDFGLVA